MVTLKMIAQRCGVSVAAASKAINHMPGVSLQKARFIRDTARAMGYPPLAGARAAADSSSSLIGVLLPMDESQGLRDPFLAGFLEGFRRAMDSHGHHLLLLSRGVGQQDTGLLASCLKHALKGVLAAYPEEDDPELVSLSSAGIPLVFLGRGFPGHPSVCLDYNDGVRQAVLRASALGHRDLAFVWEDASHPEGSGLEAFRAALREAGIPAREELLVIIGRGDASGAGAAAERLLSLPEPPTCVLFGDDSMTQDGLRAIRESGLSVPGDVSVISIEGIKSQGHDKPSHALARRNPLLMGEKAAGLLYEHMEEKGKPWTKGAFLLPMDIDEGDSLAPPSVLK